MHCNYCLYLHLVEQDIDFFKIRYTAAAYVLPFNVTCIFICITTYFSAVFYKGLLFFNHFDTLLLWDA